MRSFGGSCVGGRVVPSCGRRIGRPVRFVCFEERIRLEAQLVGGFGGLDARLRISTDESPPLGGVDLVMREGIDLDLLLNRRNHKDNSRLSSNYKTQR